MTTACMSVCVCETPLLASDISIMPAHAGSLTADTAGGEADHMGQEGRGGGGVCKGAPAKGRVMMFNRGGRFT